MSEQRKRRPRDYDGRRRAAASGATRERILVEARRAFLELGYSATTMASIARAAGVHVDTVYELVGRKTDVVAALVERALSGTEHAVAAAERPYVAAIVATSDPHRKIEIYAAATRAMLERVAPLVTVLRDAAGTDVAVRDLWRGFADRRAENMRTFVADVAAAAGGLRVSMGLDAAADAVWVTNSPEVFSMLAVERGWTPGQYERWLVDTWSRLLLPD